LYVLELETLVTTRVDEGAAYLPPTQAGEAPQPNRPGKVVPGPWKARGLPPLTADSAKNHPKPSAGKIILRSQDPRGFCLVITSKGARTYCYETRIAGYKSSKRKKIGASDRLSFKEAREEARKRLGTADKGENPLLTGKQIAASETVEAVAAEFAAAHKLGAHRRRAYTSMLKNALKGFATRKILSLEPTDVRRAFLAYRAKRPMAANVAFGALQAWFTFAAAGKGLMNPVSVLTELKLWEPDKRCRRVIAADGFAAWWRATCAEEFGVFFQFLAFTGGRAMEILQAKWEDIDLAARSWRIAGYKGRERRKDAEDFILPMGPYLTQLLVKLKARGAGVGYVFAHEDGTPYRSYRRAQQRLRARCPEAGDWSAHSLRRMYMRLEEEVGVPAKAAAQLVNHMAPNPETTGVSAVHAGYIHHEFAALKRWQEQMEAAILAKAGVKS
jgi:integrase